MSPHLRMFCKCFIAFSICALSKFISIILKNETKNKNSVSICRDVVKDFFKRILKTKISKNQVYLYTLRQISFSNLLPYTVYLTHDLSYDGTGDFLSQMKMSNWVYYKQMVFVHSGQVYEIINGCSSVLFVCKFYHNMDMGMDA